MDITSNKINVFGTTFATFSTWRKCFLAESASRRNVPDVASSSPICLFASVSALWAESACNLLDRASRFTWLREAVASSNSFSSFLDLSSSSFARAPSLSVSLKWDENVSPG